MGAVRARAVVSEPETEWAIDRSSGVFRRVSKFPAAGPAPIDLARTLYEMTDSPSAVLLEPSCGLGVRGACYPAEVAPEDFGFPLALRLNAWLVGIDSPRKMIVPEFIKPWLGLHVAIAVPLQTVWKAGTCVISADSRNKQVIRTIEGRMTEFVLQLETADRRFQVASLADECDAD